MGDAHHCSGPPVSEMTYTVSSGTLNPSIPYHTIPPPYSSSLALIKSRMETFWYRLTQPTQVHLQNGRAHTQWSKKFCFCSPQGVLLWSLSGYSD